MKSKYGHNRRPCEVCFEGSSVLCPRVACRDCGLMVHTNCHGLREGEKETTASELLEDDEYHSAQTTVRCVGDDSNEPSILSSLVVTKLSWAMALAALLRLINMYLMLMWTCVRGAIT